SKREIERARSGTAFDAFVVNDDLGRTIEEVARIVGERLRATRR
ncbi:MAG: hypothetical protein RI990_818, partial [Planctomycetota bacterium]